MNLVYTPQELLPYSSIIQEAETWEDMVAVGLELRQYKDMSQWYLGALAARAETKYGEQSLEKLAKEIGVAHRTLQVYRWVVKKYQQDNPEFSPHEKIPFGIYQTVADLPPEERDKLLEKADEQNLSVEKVRYLKSPPETMEDAVAMECLKELSSWCSDLFLMMQDDRKEAAKHIIAKTYKLYKSIDMNRKIKIRY